MMTLHGVTSFLAGVLLANAVPHFVHGISGDRFPTPFADPPGRGLSSSIVNMAWALFNFFAGYLCFRFSGVGDGSWTKTLAFFCGVAAIGLALSVRFSQKHE